MRIQNKEKNFFKKNEWYSTKICQWHFYEINIASQKQVFIAESFIGKVCKQFCFSLLFINVIIFYEKKWQQKFPDDLFVL